MKSFFILAHDNCAGACQRRWTADADFFSTGGGECTVLDYSLPQLETERMVAERDGYRINIVHGDMTKPLPFESDSFNLIFHLVANCYVEKCAPDLAGMFPCVKEGRISPVRNG